jgi:hypothetical protein
MQRLDGNYLYLIGSQIHPLSEFTGWATAGKQVTTHSQALYPLYVAETALDNLISRSVYSLRTCYAAGQTLLSTIRRMKQEAEAAEDKDTPVSLIDVISLTSQLSAFENVLAAELGMMPIYIVSQKAGFDTATLIDLGAKCFPQEIISRVPEAIRDLEMATRCIAFELATASGFHLHRANEAVLHRYWDAVSNGANRPKSRNMGDYLKAMEDKKYGDQKVRSALKDLKDLHRNPLIHPEDNLSISEAIALMNGIYTVMVHMLKVIPEAQTSELSETTLPDFSSEGTPIT